MRKILLGLAALCLLAVPRLALAQALVSGVPVASCNNQSYTLGQPSPLTMTTGGELCDTGSGGGGGSNAAAGPTGSAVPADASYNGLNVGGTLRGQTGVNPSGSVYAAQTDLTSVGGTSIALGQTTMSASLPVAFASNQSALTVTQATASSLNAAVVGNVASGSADSGDGVKVAGVYNTTIPTLTNAQRGDFQLDASANLLVDIAGTVQTGIDGRGNTSGLAYIHSPNSLTGSALLQIAPSVFNSSTWDRLYSATAAAGTTGTGVQAAGAMGFDGTDYRRLLTDTAGDLSVIPAASPQGGATPVSINSANTTNATNVKASAGTLYHISVQNTSTTALGYLIFFNTASTPTCTGTPYYGPVAIPYVGSTGNNGSGVIEDFGVGLSFTTGISYCITTAVGGTGAVAANAITGGLSYK